MSEKRDMYYNFDMIMPRLVDSFDHLDIEHANSVLSSIEHNCLCIGTGGSNSVAHFASVVLEHVNGIIALSKEPREVIHMNLNDKHGYGKYRHLLGITYGNSNYGINEAKKMIEQSHLITTNSTSKSDICYKGSLPNERSFISLASTIIPMSILLKYFLKADKNELLDLMGKMYLNASEFEYDFNFNGETPLFEIMSGEDSYVASKVLESTIVEAGLGIPVVHEKYSYCHGRSTFTYHNKNSNLIYLINDETNLDNHLLTVLKELYKNVVVIHSKENDYVIGEFDLALKSLFLCKIIAEQQKKDLSRVEHYPNVKKLYYYDGGM